MPARGKELDEDGVDWHQRGHFEEDDANEDEFVDPLEILHRTSEEVFKRARMIHLVSRLAKADGNRDGKLSQKEFSQLSSQAKQVWLELGLKEKPLDLQASIPTLYWLEPANLKSLLPE